MSAATAASIFQPAWPVPASVRAAASTRAGGSSQGPWASFNLGGACGDDAQAVAANRQAFAQALGARAVWLQQVHGSQVLRLERQAFEAGQPMPPADAAWTTEPGLACCVLVADCLPVLVCSADGRAVAAAHAGWRGLVSGVLEATLQALHTGADVPPGDLLAWLGPSIGPQAFEVTEDVPAAFGAGNDPQVAACFRPGAERAGRARWWADLPGLARLRLQRAGVRHIHADGRCTVQERSAFFSYRRDGVTGRQAAAIWRLG